LQQGAEVLLLGATGISKTQCGMGGKLPSCEKLYELPAHMFLCVQGQLVVSVQRVAYHGFPDIHPDPFEVPYEPRRCCLSTGGAGHFGWRNIDTFQVPTLKNGGRAVRVRATLSKALS